MEIHPEQRVTATNPPAPDDSLEALGILGVFHVFDELRYLRSRNVEHEVGVAAEYPGIEGQRVQPRLIAQRFADHECNVAVGAVAQQAVDLALAAGGFNAQHGRLR
ncbi:hypothetical protein D3C71_1772360 [compost metagenome]